MCVVEVVFLKMNLVSEDYGTLFTVHGIRLAPLFGGIKVVGARICPEMASSADKSE